MLTQQIVTNALQKAMSLDALESSHSISIEVNHPDQIAQIYDAITYQKGQIILQCLFTNYSTATNVERKIV